MSVYRFVYAAGTTYYLRLIVAGETLDKTVAPAAKGLTAVSLSQVALLSALMGRVDVPSSTLLAAVERVAL